LSSTAVRDVDGVPTSYLGIVRDVTHRLEVEQALVAALDTERELTTRLREVDMQKTDFVANVSHELRTPLASIIGYTELLEEEVAGDLNPAQRDLIARITRNSGRLHGLIEDLLTLGEIERGTFEMENRQLDLRDTVRAAVEGAAAQQSASGVALSCELPDRPVILEGDAAQLERMVTNLLGNALKFTLAGGWVRLSVNHAREGTVLTVSDNGIGIPQEEQDLLFQRFFRSSSSREQEIQGTGLGLSIVRSIAEAHGGTIACESEPGVGTTFQVTFPKRGVIPFPTNRVAV
jgi:signal transduction histidine kinase